MRRALLILPVLLAGCGILGLDEDSRERDRLERNQRTWSERGPSSYSFVLQRMCFCPLEVVSAVRIVVEDGAVASRTYVESGLAVGPQFQELFPDILHEAFEHDADQVEVTYDAELGFPRNASIDYVRNAVDDELAFEVRELTPR